MAIQTKLIKKGNSFAVIMPDSLVRDGKLVVGIELYQDENGIFITPKTKAREGWTEQLALAGADAVIPDGELLEGFDDECDKWEWAD